MAAATLIDRTISQSEKRRFSGAFFYCRLFPPVVSVHTSIDGIKAVSALFWGASSCELVRISGQTREYASPIAVNQSNSGRRNGGRLLWSLPLRFTELAAERRVDGFEADSVGHFATLPAASAVVGRFRGTGTTSAEIAAADPACGAARDTMRRSGTVSDALPFSSAISRCGASAGRSVGSNGATGGTGS
jgi:hypothetical protein